MRRIIAVFVILSFIIVAPAYGGRRGRAPQVRNVSPMNDSEVVIGPEGVDFKWKVSPVPGGGRRAFRFKLFKGFGYGSIEKHELNPDVISINIPADVFEDGEIYVWEVSQRGLRGWSDPCRWSFKAKKEKIAEETEETEEDYK